MLPLLIVRPEPGASQTAARATALGLEPHIIPLFEISSVGWAVADPGAFDALLLTSANAARHAGAGLAALADLPCFAVGDTTAEAARAHGLNPVMVGNSDAQFLVDAMVAGGYRTILWLTGAEHSAIDAGPARITPVITYAAPEVAPPVAWDAVIARPAVVMLHSARAARRVGEIVGPLRNHLIALAISAPVADACGTGWHRLAVAATPTDADMLALALELCQTL